MTTPLRRYEFSERLAEILGESRRDLRFRVTLMTSGGLVAPGPRGPGSPPTTPDYAADLLIGVLAAPQQVHTVEAIRCYRALRPTVVGPDAAAPGIALGRPALRHSADALDLPLLAGRPRFGDALARLLDHAADAAMRDLVARQLFGIWVSRGFPAAAVQLAAWWGERRVVIAQRYELGDGERPPAWLDPDRGGTADPGLFQTVFLPASKLIEIARFIASSHERNPRVLDLGQTIAHLAHLARNRRNRRPWENFLAKAAPAQDSAETIDARVSRLVEVPDFGANPGNLRMLTYVPADLPPAAGLVVVLHGCTQTAASYDYGTGWSTLADRYGFALLLPEQRRSNNPLRCFNWFRAEDNARDSGEALSIRQMVARMIALHGIDPRRVFVTGVSAGGAMSTVMLATYPDVFAGGAIIAGVPYRCANGLQDAFEVIFQGRSRPAAEWGALVRSASSHPGPWPRVAVWHGAVDPTVKPSNATEIVKQWTDVHGLAAFPTDEDTIDGHPHCVWRDAAGKPMLESYTINGMGHGVPIDPSGEEGCGVAAPFILDAGISSTFHIAKSWGLAEHRRPTAEPARRPSRPAAAAADAVSGGDAPAHPVIVVDPAGRAHAGAGSRADGPGWSEGAGRFQEAASGGIDVQAILAKSFELAGLAAGLGGAGAGAKAGGGKPAGVDVQSILAKSFELAGLAGGLRQKPSPQPRSRPAAGAASAGERKVHDVEPEPVAAEPVAAEPAAVQPETPIVRSDTAGADASEADRFAGSGWESHGWELVEGGGPADGTVLFGYASSGRGGEVGSKVRSVSRLLTLGRQPRLSYVRKLDLRASVNVLTAASFTVRIDGVPVDEASAIGMDYTENEWTEGSEIDLSTFAGRTVTLTCEVAANANACVEVFAKAWLKGITVRDAATATSAG